MHQKPLLVSLFALGLSTPALADDVFNDDVIIPDNLCVGASCSDGETFTPGLPLRLNANAIGIDFDDNAGNADNDWAIRINNSTQEFFSIEDVTLGLTPFQIFAQAGPSAIVIEPGGDVGFGTTLPDADIHILDADNAELRLESSTQGADWVVSAGSTGFVVGDKDAGGFPLVIENGAPLGAVRVATDGDVGLGTNTPEGKVHIKGDGVQLTYLESGDGGPVQMRFRTDSENRRFLAVNNANEVKSQIIFLDDRINFTGQTDSGANLWLSIGPNGILSQGGTCNVNPCDRTFDPDFFTVAPIEERAAYMWEHMHLPAVGPTTAGEPINLTEKTTGMLHELEVAHIYIEQLHGEIDALKTVNAQVLARLEALEAE